MNNSRELSLTRHIEAPPDKVWDVLVNRQEEWFCPKPGAPRSTIRTAGPAAAAT